MIDLRHIFIRYAVRKKSVHPTRVIIWAFMAIILVGTALLMLPVSSRFGGITPPLTALFTATSATSVTGLVLVDTYSYWSLFGQAVILILIQIGGLGFMSVISIFFFLLNKRVGLRERLVIMQSLNLDEIEGVMGMMRHVLIGTFLLESAGALILSIQFVPEFGVAGGIWRGIFHSVSAFCNSGFDIMAGKAIFSSAEAYSGSPVVLLTLAALIIIGSLGFYVWEDIFRTRKFSRFRLHTKLVLVVTLILLVLGMVMYIVTEGNNPNSMGKMGFGEKLLVSFFQSASSRTTGFDLIGQATLNENTRIISMILMFIGGSSGGTAGGVKTVTIAVIFLSVLSTLRGRRELNVFGRRIPNTKILDAVTIVTISLVLIFIGTTAVSMTLDIPFVDALFETVSAYGTAGLTIGITGMLPAVLQILYIIFMFFGKIGITTIGIAFLMRTKNGANVVYPTGNVMIG